MASLDAPSFGRRLINMEARAFERLRSTYRDLHAHPELSGKETRTAAVAAKWLTGAGYQVREQVGGTGVVGTLTNGSGPTVVMRADMDALPVHEATGVEYASTVAGVMHACGHDVHVTCMLGAAGELGSSRDGWKGTLVIVFQPAEETASGASAMIEDGLFDHLPKPDVVLGQHVAPIPAGVLGLRAGVAFAAVDSLRLTLHGKGGHGSRPETTVDPVVMAASTVMRLQGIVAREIAATDMAVMTIGALNAGTKGNIIPDRAELLMSVRSYDPRVRAHVLEAIERIARGESMAAGAPQGPEIQLIESAPAVVNDDAAAARTRTALASKLGGERIVDPGPVTGSEDVGLLASAAGAPLVFWLLGGADPALFKRASTIEQIAAVMATTPSNHSPFYAPVEDPTLRVGVDALTTAAREWLAH
jgi:hippurate hydrolase